MLNFTKIYTNYQKNCESCCNAETGYGIIIKK